MHCDKKLLSWQGGLTWDFLQDRDNDIRSRRIHPSFDLFIESCLEVVRILIALVTCQLVLARRYDRHT